jgi:hypothetical protein
VTSTHLLKGDKMPHFHPTYGDLLSAKEVSDATHFTMNQLRNWRTDSRSHLAPFGSIQLGGTSYYRKVVVQAWIERNGVQTGVYRMTDLDREFPIAEGALNDLDKANAIAVLSRFTTENVCSWLESQIDKHTAFISKTWEPTWLSVRADYVTKNNRWDDVSWFPTAVLVCRKVLSDQQGFNLSDDELQAIPVGAVPPLNEKK